MIKNKYIHPRIEVCRNCQGTGSIILVSENQNDDNKIITCELCAGTGRVIISKKIEITIKPFK